MLYPFLLFLLLISASTPNLGQDTTEDSFDLATPPREVLMTRDGAFLPPTGHPEVAILAGEEGEMAVGVVPSGPSGSGKKTPQYSRK